MKGTAILHCRVPAAALTMTPARGFRRDDRQRGATVERYRGRYSAARRFEVRQSRPCRHGSPTVAAQDVRTVINLKPASKWQPGMPTEKLTVEMDRALRIPGVSNAWTGRSGHASTCFRPVSERRWAFVDEPRGLRGHAANRGSDVAHALLRRAATPLLPAPHATPQIELQGLRSLPLRRPGRLVERLLLTVSALPQPQCYLRGPLPHLNCNRGGRCQHDASTSREAPCTRE